MKLLPKWILPGTQPAIYDAESKTIQQQTARIYQKMNELIEDYNAFVDDVNSRITEHNDKMDHDLEVYAQSLRQEFQDFIDVCTLQIEALQQEANKYFTGDTPVPKSIADKNGNQIDQTYATHLDVQMVHDSLNQHIDECREYVDSMVEDLYETLNNATYGSGE